MLKFECLEQCLSCERTLLNTSLEHDIHYTIRNVFEYMFSTNARLETISFVVVKHLFAFQNSIQSSNCLRLRSVLGNESIRRFKYILNTDLASCRLKLASILYCSGHLRAVARVLEDLERIYHSKVKAVCGCVELEGDRDLQVFADMLSGHSVNEFSKPQFACCVRFLRQEVYCTPVILLFKMNRNMSEKEVAQRGYADKQWMDNAVVDSRPFLHYLQYLTYRGLGEREKQLHVLGVLEFNICDTRKQIQLYHPNTALHLLGHCYEMEGDYDSALHYYDESLRCCGTTNNAANWHVQRVRRVRRLISG
ncbi:hypothetical protein DPMN_094322 [Dreissena polymorpha]|uniref:Uncharacterized protein n=1 Tax=Dreissena polymorpha TaxID=45954 RepID=A0A9D4R3F6_DREPO|nr:hypothetical protein DPMN_094322 [Dreissena polymorpha]